MPSKDLAQALQDPVLPSPRENSKHPSYDSHARAPASGVSSRPSTPRRLSTASLSQLLSFQSTSRASISNGTQQVYQSPSASNDSSAQLAEPVPARSEMTARMSGSFGKMALNSMIGGFTSLSLSRTSANNDEKDKDKESRGRRPRSSSFGFPTASKDKEKEKDTASAKEPSRTRSQSPFAIRRFRSRDRERDRDQSPAPLPLEESDSESIISRRSVGVRPRNAFTDDADSGSEIAAEDTEDEEDDWSDDGAMLDFLTERNTEQNAQIAVGIGEADGDGDVDAAMDPDPLGEGVNVVVPPEPYFPSTLNRSSFGSVRGRRGVPKRRKSKNQEFLPLSTSRPLFQRDRCTITVTQGHPESSGRRKRTYVVASDLSDESKYAIEWGIGTVLRDGDELCAS